MAKLVFNTIGQGKIALVNHFYDNKTSEELDYIENNFDVHCDQMAKNIEKYFDAPRSIAIEAIQAFREFCSVEVA